MRRLIVLLLITGTVWAQTDFDKLILDDGTETLGVYSKVKENLVYFKPTGALAFQGVPINRIRSLQLRDGKTIIQDEYIKIRTILDYKHLSIKDKAIYDAKKDARRWLVFPPKALISSCGLGTAISFIFKGPPVFAVFSLGLVGSYNLFNIEDIKNIEGTSAEDIELYKKMYYKQFKKQKLENIMISAGATALIAGAVIHVLNDGIV